MATVEKNQIKEAQRYLDNARKILTENAGKYGDYYSDPKYVKMAGNTAWNGVLVALDAVTDVRKNLKSRQRPDFKDYQQAAAKKDGRINKKLVTAYDSLHKVLGYDGNLRVPIVMDALKQGDIIINWASKHYSE